MAGSKRQQKFSKLIQKEISQIFQLEFSGDFVGTLVTITEVTMSPDLGLARVYVSVFPVGKTDAILSHINDRKSKVRGRLGRTLGKEIRVVPEIAFFADHTNETAARMDSLIDSLNIPEEPEDTES